MTFNIVVPFMSTNYAMSVLRQDLLDVVKECNNALMSQEAVESDWTLEMNHAVLDDNNEPQFVGLLRCEYLSDLTQVEVRFGYDEDDRETIFVKCRHNNRNSENSILMNSDLWCLIYRTFENSFNELRVLDGRFDRFIEKPTVAGLATVVDFATAL